MALATRYRTVTGIGLVVALILVVIFGSPMYADWVRDNADPNNAGGWFLHTLAWPAWDFDPDESLRDLFADSLRAIFVVVFTAVFLALLPGSQLTAVRGRISQLLAGWAAYIFAAAVAALLTALIRSDPSFLGVVRAATDGAAYGLFVGWIVGLATVGTRRA